MAPRTRPARTRPISLTFASLLVIPIVSVVALWGFAASVTLADTVAKRDYDSRISKTGGPGRALLMQVVQERLQSVVWLGGGRQSSHVPLELQREQTDTAVAAFRKGAAEVRGLLNPAAKQNLATLLGRLGSLGAIRNGIDLGAMKPPAAFKAYNGILDAEFQFLYSAAATNDASIYQRATANIDASRALEMVSRENALVSKSLVANGHMSAAEHGLFVSALANQRLLENQVLAELSERFAAPYKQLFTSAAYASFRSMENSIAAGSHGDIRLLADPAAWRSQTQAFLTAFDHAVTRGRQDVSQSADRSGNEIRLRLALAGGLGLIAVAASIYLLLRFSHRITGELRGLHSAARELADERLPQVLGRLRRGEDVDVDATVPALPMGAVTEVASIAQALATAARAAFEAAVGQARLRRNVNQVFLSLAHRNQSLLHRQLDMLDAMERTTSDPHILEGFSLLDHLTTRMRRHTESLIILSGEVPGRGWRSPVHVTEVIRAAVAEILDYARVDVVTDSRDAVVGASVADIVHLLAELIENATAFSPPNTRVTVSAGRVANGFVIEVEDRGIGIEASELAEINIRLASPPQFEFADSDRLGLLVVGHLATRHQIKVAFRESPFGGTSVVVLMPHSMIVPERELATPVGSVAAAVRWASSGPASSASAAGDFAADSARSVWSPASRRVAWRDAADEGTDRAAQNTASSSGPARLGTPGPAGDGAPGELPRRIRQANLAPQLRTGRLRSFGSPSDDGRVAETADPDGAAAAPAPQPTAAATPAPDPGTGQPAPQPTAAATPAPDPGTGQPAPQPTAAATPAPDPGTGQPTPQPTAAATPAPDPGTGQPAPQPTAAADTDATVATSDHAPDGT